jgi:flagellar biosynthetic protein FliS
MDQRLRHFYNESRVKNASPGQLLVLLYDDLVQSAEIAQTQIAAPDGSTDRAEAPLSVGRCIRAITELSAALRPEHDPKLCADLNSLYRFFAREFSEALAKSEAGRIGAILPLLRKLRATWAQVQKMSVNPQVVIV